jgi:hypothetical protein
MRLSLRRTIAAALLAAVPVLTAAAASPASHASSPAPLRTVRNAIPGDYIVSLTPGTDPATVTDRIGVKPKHVYRDALTGFAAPLTDAQLTQVRALPAVTAVEQDSTVTVSPVEQRPVQVPKPVPGQRAGTGIPWGLERINARAPGGTGFNVKATGAKVTAYIIDSGIDSPTRSSAAGPPSASTRSPTGATALTAPGTARMWPAPWAVSTRASRSR